MTSRQGLKIIAGMIALFTILLASFNWIRDPQCFYKCADINPEKISLNSYYKAAQKAFVHADTELVLVGSSRGETTPPQLLEDIFGLKSLNLSVAGADFQTKRGFLRLVQQEKTLKKVIWLADYFEMLPGRTDAKMLRSAALSKWTDFPKTSAWNLRDLQSLVDHNTFEAALSFSKKSNQIKTLDRGAGSSFDLVDCKSAAGATDLVQEEVLKKEVALIYQNYASSVLQGQQSAQDQQKFKDFVQSSTGQGTQWIIWIAPYHPEFRRRLMIEHPEVWKAHLDWIQGLKMLQSNNVEVLDFLSQDIPFVGDSNFWNDGVHFNCRAVAKMLTFLKPQSQK